MAISCLVVAPFSAAVAAPALRRPWARPGTPASTHRSRNQLPKRQIVSGVPFDVTKKVRSPVWYCSVLTGVARARGAAWPRRPCWDAALNGVRTVGAECLPDASCQNLSELATLKLE